MKFEKLKKLTELGPFKKTKSVATTVIVTLSIVVGLTFNYVCQLRFMYTAMLTSDKLAYVYLGIFLITIVVCADIIAMLLNYKRAVGYAIVFVSLFFSLYFMSINVPMM
ncbi:MAG: hypothetical protein LBT59_11700 [Clostridiales bacterium]|jgi:hypothetical protein|nr:hypothetical protein [Clostridiales bacterium]